MLLRKPRRPMLMTRFEGGRRKSSSGYWRCLCSIRVVEGTGHSTPSLTNARLTHPTHQLHSPRLKSLHRPRPSQSQNIPRHSKPIHLPCTGVTFLPQVQPSLLILSQHPHPLLQPPPRLHPPQLILLPLPPLHLRLHQDHLLSQLLIMLLIMLLALPAFELYMLSNPQSQENSLSRKVTSSKWSIEDMRIGGVVNSKDVRGSSQ